MTHRPPRYQRFAAVSLLVLVGVVYVAILAVSVASCTAAQGDAARAGIAEAMRQLALEVCVEGDSARVCARKCEQAADR